MIFIFVFLLAGFVILYLLSKGRYDEFLESINEEEYKLKKIFSFGLYLIEISEYKFATKYEKRLRRYIAELKGTKFCDYYLRIHYANKISLSMLVFLLMSAVGATLDEFDISYLLFMLICGVGVFFLLDKELEYKIDKRRISIQLDFPDFLNKLTLLINAGMTVNKAWEKIVEENKKNTILYNEVTQVITDIQNGKSIINAYEDFSKRCRIPEITKFISVIIQNIRKGNEELVSVLQYSAFEAWQNRKHAAKRIGEQASTKLLIPMIMMFFIIVIIVALPAVLELNI